MEPLFQSTPLREGRPMAHHNDARFNFGFNPRPCARGDRSKGWAPWVLIGFNPRPCARGDEGDHEGQAVRVYVSIHAPARGATNRGRTGRTIKRCFNPRPCARGDEAVLYPENTLREFQSTPLREGRHTPITHWMPLEMFQSTPLREGRPSVIIIP